MCQLWTLVSCQLPWHQLTSKIHVLTFHVPEKAISKGTVGMEAEHCSESIHPVVNKLDRIYATTQNTCDRLALVAKSQWLQSDSTLTNFKKPVATDTIFHKNDVNPS